MDPILALEVSCDLALHHLSSLVSPLPLRLRPPCLRAFLILQVPPHLWAFAHAITSAWNASLSLLFAQLTLSHHWILKVTSLGEFSLIPPDLDNLSNMITKSVSLPTTWRPFQCPCQMSFLVTLSLTSSVTASVASWLLLSLTKQILPQHPCTCCSLYLERSSPFYPSGLSSSVVTLERLS